MGFDLSGVKPSSTKGEYFRNNVWWWHPLWDYVSHLCHKQLTPKQREHGHYNDGIKIPATKAAAIGNMLLEEIASGRTETYAMEYAAAMKNLEPEPCEICGGTGKRKQPPDVGPGTMPCNGCGGKGEREPFVTNYPFSVENVKEFAEFCLESGGVGIF